MLFLNIINRSRLQGGVSELLSDMVRAVFTIFL
jgi:hypothetical protein